MGIEINNEKLFCNNCGGGFHLQYPIELEILNKKIELFRNLHNDCKPTWSEPLPNKEDDVRGRANWWMENGQIGASSETIWNCLMGNKNFYIDYPYDFGDFGRCYKLLNIVPEWKKDLYKLKPLSKQWSNLVDNWDELTTLYEEKCKSGKDIGFYELIQSLINLDK